MDGLQISRTIIPARITELIKSTDDENDSSDGVVAAQAIVMVTGAPAWQNISIRRKKKKVAKMSNTNTADVGFEKELWDAACVLRGNMDASEYKNVILGLIFLKYI